MGEVVNLNKFRKEKQRADEKRAARDNRVRFGRSGADKRADRLAKEKADATLDGKKRKPATGAPEDAAKPPEEPTPHAR